MGTAREREVDTRSGASPKSFSAAGVKIKSIAETPMVIRHRVWPWPEDTIYLFGRDSHSMRYGAQIFVHVFPLPKGRDGFEKEIGFYRKQKKSFLIAGKKFTPSLLAPKVSAGLRYEAFQTRDGVHRWRVVHILERPNRGVLLVYSLSCAEFDSNPFFRDVTARIDLGM